MAARPPATAAPAPPTTTTSNATGAAATIPGRPFPTPDELVKTTGFTKHQLQTLTYRFASLLPSYPNIPPPPSNDSLVQNFGTGSERDPFVNVYAAKVDRVRFRELLAEFGVQGGLLMDRVFRTFDTDADSHISFSEYIHGLRHFLSPSLPIQAAFTFRIYDLNSDHIISKDEMYTLLRSQPAFIGTEETVEEGVKELVEICLRKLDEDRDGRVGESDWMAVTQREGLLVECFGRCLPRREKVEMYLDPRGLERRDVLGRYKIELGGLREKGAVPRSATSAAGAGTAGKSGSAATSLGVKKGRKVGA
ncbi:EF-hand calcium-binding domain-containing protein 1 [Gaertneriomyces sp. JEL0708]|nr:EF-hand calcium-binding domain-containing protein 1 [Gaertneriomyces sp. JEL0708]